MLSKSQAVSIAVLCLPLTLLACGVPQEEYDALQQERDHALTEITRLEGLGQSLQNNNSQLEDRVSSLEGELDKAIDRINELAAAGESLKSNVEQLEAEKIDLGEEIESLTKAHDSLLTQIGSVEDLELKKTDLEVTVAYLEQQADFVQGQLEAIREQRAALIPETYGTSFICSGSMDPVITYMDEAVWLENFVPTDIVIGSIISFDTNGLDCNISSDHAAHRVIDIKIENDAYYFKTKGDNNTIDDGCWIPTGNIQGYIIELIEHEIPEMQELLDEIWILESEQKAVYENIGELSAEYDDALAFYLEERNKYCDFNGAQWQCPSNGYSHVLNLYTQTETLRLTLSSQIDRYHDLCENIREMRIELQQLRDQHFGPSSYVFPPCAV